MYALHGAAEGSHEGRNGDGGRLPRLDLPGVGIGEVLGQAHLGVVHQGGHLLALGNGVAGLLLRHVQELAAVGGGEVQARDVLAETVQLLLIALHLGAGGLHRGLGRRGVDGEEGLARRHHVALRHQHIQHGAGGGEGQGLAALGFHGAGARHLGGDGAVLHHFRAHVLAAAAALAAQQLPRGEGRRQQHRHDDEGADSLAALLLAEGLPLRRRRSRLGLEGVVSLQHRILDFRHSSILLYMRTAGTGRPKSPHPPEVSTVPHRLVQSPQESNNKKVTVLFLFRKFTFSLRHAPPPPAGKRGRSPRQSAPAAKIESGRKSALFLSGKG